MFMFMTDFPFACTVAMLTASTSNDVIFRVSYSTHSSLSRLSTKLKWAEAKLYIAHRLTYTTIIEYIISSHQAE